MDYSVILQDFDYPIKFKCHVCHKIGLPFERIDNNKMPWNLCHSCGYYHTNKRSISDERKWYKSWKENGSLFLFDLPMQDRCEIYKKIEESYNRKKYFVLSESQIKKKELDRRVLAQYGFKKVKSDKKIVVEVSNENSLSFDYETNKILFINGDECFVTLVEEKGFPFLLVNGFLASHEEGISEPVRRSFYGLIPQLFCGVYSLDDVCILKDERGNTINIWIE